jgi:uncharacterized protein YecT (DUF1311 family)
MSIRSILLLPLFLVPTVSTATEPINQELEACFEKAKSNADFSECYNSADKALDKKLNAVWAKLKRDADKTTYQEVLAAQRLWLSFRDKACPTYSEYGSMGKMLTRQCYYNVVRNRVDELIKVYDFVSF